MRDGQESYKVNNSMVVPYNPTLLKKYECHINVEYCGSIAGVKYIYNYLHKGFDKAYCKIIKDCKNTNEEIHDEISTFIDGRYMSSMEAAWRLQEFPICFRSHSVVRLAIHTENQQKLVFPENDPKSALKKWQTHLTAWFDLNKIDEFAAKIKYIHIPNYYVFNNQTKSWVKRQRQQKYSTIGRMSIVSPKDTERFYLKLILQKSIGCTSFENLRTVNGKSFKTYKETALELGLIENDEQIFKIFEEACTIMLPNQLRQFFVRFIIAENYQGNNLWLKFQTFLSEDFEEDKEIKALANIDFLLQNEGYSCKEFGLPSPANVNVSENVNNIDAKTAKKKFLSLFSRLTSDQKKIFNIITNKHSTNYLYFIDGPGGCGKTYLYKTLIYYFISVGKNVISMAWTGIASILLPLGMTSHRTFRLPLNLNEVESARLELESDKKKLREADIILWDEASMIPKKALEIVDITLRDLCNSSIPFAKKLFILGGDFRQILPVVKNGNKNDIIQDTIKFSHLWPLFTLLKLHKNLRCIDSKFSSFLLDIGEGRVKNFIVPNSWKTNNISESIYKNISVDDNNVENSVILAPHNEDIDKLNNKILNFLPGIAKTFYSIDCATYKGVDKSDENIYLQYPPETLHKIREGLPPHELKLKTNAQIMLLRNLSGGLCNGTRLKIKKIHNYILECTILTGENINSTTFIPRITSDTGKSSTFPFLLYRKQFPIRLAFAITINKSQGQSFDRVGLYMCKPLFAHGQLYVALSRCRNPNEIYIQNNLTDDTSIENIVWPEVLE